ncbi:SDR family NAD(P)-dependent oxidoreductase [Roseibium sp. RKSG952]|uniref:SDR family NAD(P)-dependent oxidoreductase n=1 Tax=Roseibium sp. RKSG952 TaxID=2529384 RepID=UPI001FCAFC52|nr:SDR family NAD(P)-dependent oxidoreductase [Roseibium sp. RKSG952]
MGFGTAIVIGQSGGIGEALYRQLEGSGLWQRVVGLSRATTPVLDLKDERAIEACAAYCQKISGDIQLVIDATGVLSWEGHQPEKSWRQLDPKEMQNAFLVNAIGPGLLMKHFLPLLPKDRKSVFATLSARVGSIEDNHTGGWYSYRASKAALNQLVRTASIELRRKNRQAICVALHPGTVDTPLSGQFAKTGLEVQSPGRSAARLLGVIERLRAEDNGCFFDHMGKRIPW